VKGTSQQIRFDWAGKQDAIRTLQTPAVSVLVADRSQSVGFDGAENIFIEGENLEVLKLLQESYAGRIKLIYLDPPYNTNTDRVYKDSRAHSTWLSTMYPRLSLARQLLADDGIICVSIDDHEVHNLRILMNEIFGEENFTAQISVIINPKGRGLREHFAVCHDYILFYTRKMLTENIGVEKSKEQIEREYPIIEGRRRYRLLELRNTHRQFNRVTRRKMWYPLYVDPSSGRVFCKKDESHIEVWPTWTDGLEGCWTWGRPMAQRSIAMLVGRQAKGHWKIFRKAYADDEHGNVVRKKLQTVWNERRFHTEVGQSELDELLPGRVFDAPKPIGLLKQIIEACTRSDKGEIILDFFAGSATTGHAVMALNSEDDGNRRFILVQWAEPTPNGSNARKAGFETISQISRSRLKKAMTQLDPQKFGFRAFKLQTFPSHPVSQASPSPPQDLLAVHH
jgi:adenine-specific DNA-methyltransferase